MKTLTAAFVLLAAPALAECPSAEAMYAAADGWIAGQRLPDPGVTTLEDGACGYAHFREGLEDPFGRPVGVKVGFTSKPAQEAFGVPGPVAGALFAPMILADGQPVSLSGSRSPLYEADLIVTVADPAITQATTREQVAAALDEVRPFVELPDIALAEGLKPTGPIMATYGVLPWRGVMGQGVKIADLPDPVADLSALTVDLKVNGESVGTGTGEMLLGHPLDVVLWLVQQGSYDMPAGTIISLGSLGKLTPATPGLNIQADYMVGGHPMQVGFDLID